MRACPRPYGRKRAQLLTTFRNVSGFEHTDRGRRPRQRAAQPPWPSVGRRAPLDDLDVVAVGVADGADQAERHLLDLAHPRHVLRLEVLLDRPAVVDGEVEDHPCRLLGGARHVAVLLDEQRRAAELERAHLVLVGVGEARPIPVLHRVDLARADEDAAKRWDCHHEPLSSIGLTIRPRRW